MRILVPTGDASVKAIANSRIEEDTRKRHVDTMEDFHKIAASLRWLLKSEMLPS